MFSSVEALILEAVAALKRNGDEAIASSLGALLARPQIQHLHSCRVSEVGVLADQIFACSSIEALHALLPRLAAALGVAHCTIHCVRERAPKLYRTRILTTYPEAWAAEYVSRRYSLVDPVVSRCEEGPGAFFWDEAPRANPATRAFFESAASHGVGPAGITFVLENAHGNLVAVTLASTEDDASFRRAFTPLLPDLNGLAALMVEVFAELAGGRDRPRFRATGAQLELLRAAVQRRSGHDTGAARAEHPAAKATEQAVLDTFGTRTLAEAAALAGRAGLIEGLPYSQEDIFVPRPDGEPFARAEADPAALATAPRADGVAPPRPDA